MAIPTRSGRIGWLSCRNEQFRWEWALPISADHSSDNGRRGLAFGWFNFAIGVAALPSSLIFGWIYERFGPLAAFGWGAGMAVLATVLLVGLRLSRDPVGKGSD